jgi:hypothetical protein
MVGVLGVVGMATSSVSCFRPVVFVDYELIPRSEDGRDFLLAIWLFKYRFYYYYFVLFLFVSLFWFFLTNTLLTVHIFWSLSVSFCCSSQGTLQLCHISGQGHM